MSGTFSTMQQMSDMSQRYDRVRVIDFYDQHGGNEPLVPKRLDEVVSRRAHTALLNEFVKPGDRVLEVGAGLGIFTVELIRLGARVVAADISAQQLRRHEEHMIAAGLQAGVEDRIAVDVVDLSVLPTSSFDHAICFRGPLGYALDQAEVALQELFRVTRPGGAVLISVFSFWGWLSSNLLNLTMRRADLGVQGLDDIVRDRIVSQGDGPAFRLFTFDELQIIVGNSGGRIRAACSDGFLCRPPQLAPGAPDDNQLVELLLEWEDQASRQSGLVDAGVRILLVASTMR